MGSLTDPEAHSPPYILEEMQLCNNLQYCVLTLEPDGKL